MAPIRILLADDHPLIRSGMQTLLQGVEGLEIVGEAEDGEEAVIKTGELSPDVLIIDISMPKLSGIEATKIIKQKFPKTRILALSMHEDEEYVTQVLKSGANGYIVKSSEKEELISAIRAVASGDDFYSAKISGMMIKNYLTASGIRPDPADHLQVPITKREREILRLIAQGLTTKEISEKLFISHRTVDTHRTNLLRKLKLRNTAALVRFALENKLITAKKVPHHSL